MKARLCFAAASCLAFAFAQDRPTTPSSSPQSASPVQSQSDSSQQTGQDSKTTMSGKGAPAEMKTQTYKGVLVDMSCAGGGGSQSSTASNATSTAAESARSATEGAKTATAGAKTAAEGAKTAAGAATSAAGGATSAQPGSSSNSADRTGTTGGNCAVSANSTQLGLKMEDGKTVRFDMVGNQRAQDYIKNNKKWNEAASSGKEIHAKVSGAMSGDKLIVSSIH
jgi:hypothetical protein